MLPCISWLVIYEMGLGLPPWPCLVQERQPRILSDGDLGSGLLPHRSRKLLNVCRPLFPWYDGETEARLGS